MNYNSSSNIGVTQDEARVKNQTDYIGFRATDAERKKLEILSQQTGMKMSEILRALVADATVEPVTTYKVIAGGRWGKRVALDDLHHR